MINTHVNPSSTKPSVRSVLRRIARERAKIINHKEKTAENALGRLPFPDALFLSKFISESAFYVEELERHIDEELLDYWQTRDHALRILTGVLIQETQPQTKEI
jgi:hypothetical protein